MELLSPAGNIESFNEALESGANAIYLGLPWFNARKPAKNFTPETLAEALDRAHSKNVKVYVTLNTDIKPNEIEDAAKVLQLVKDLKVDAVIIKDFGLYYLAKECFPEIELHLSTQFGIANSYAAEMAKKLGAKRVIPARELSFDELESLHNSQMDIPEIEAFVQGSMCFSVSGKCLLSSWVGGKSANRGVCQAPCRLKYSSTDREFPFFSMKDLNLSGKLDRLEKAHVSSLKIEGRLKNPGWVGSITSIYSSALKGEKLQEDTNSALLKYSGREMGEGFASGLEDLTSRNRAKFGKFLGRVKEVIERDGKKYLVLDFSEKSIDTSLRFVTEDDEFLTIIHPENINLEKQDNGTSLLLSSGREVVNSLIYEVVPSKVNNSGIGKMRYDVELELFDNEIEIAVYTDEGVYKEREPFKRVVKEKRGVYPDAIYDKLTEKVVNGWRFNKLYCEEILLSKTQVNSIVKVVSYILAVTIQESSPLNIVELNDKTREFIKPIATSRTDSTKEWVRVSLGLLNQKYKNIIVDEIVMDVKELDKVIKMSNSHNIVVSLFPICFENDMSKIKDIVNYLESKSNFIYEINDIGHYNLLVNYLNISTDRIWAGYGISAYNNLGLRFIKEVLGIKTATIPMEMDSRGIIKISEDNSGYVELNFSTLSRVPVMYSRAQSPDFFEGAEFIDNIGTEFYVHKYNGLNIFYAKDYFSSNGCRDIESFKFSNEIKDLICLENPDNGTRKFNLERRLY